MRSSDLFGRANVTQHKALCAQWHRHESKQWILRSQVGFCAPKPSRPVVCQGCGSYHGIAYGYSLSRRSVLICAVHPLGWQGKGACPDWKPDL